MPNPSWIPVVAYYRMSTDKQDKSIPEQRVEVIAYAKKKGYKIVREYIDEGISGDATEKRFGFQNMIRDAAGRRDFMRIVCWDLDRFGRFDSIEAGYWIKQLRDADVRLDTIAQGEQDWSGFAGRVIQTVQQEGKHQFLRDLSRNTTRALRQIAQSGRLTLGRTPFGYDKAFLDQGGQEVARIRRGAPIARLDGWLPRFVASADPREVEIVREIFETYARGGTSPRELAGRLNDRGIPRPGASKAWLSGTVINILKNPVYIGSAVFGRTAVGKYFQVSRDEIRTISGQRTRGWRRKPEAEWITVEDAHEALITHRLWDAVQRQFASRHDAPSTPKHKWGNEYLLSGLVFCGKCGRAMGGDMGEEYPRYRCQTYAMFGNKLGCGCWTIRQSDLIDLLFDEFENHYFSKGGREGIVDLAHQRLRAKRSYAPTDADRGRKRLVELDREIKVAAERLLTAPENITHILAPQIDARRLEREALAERLAESSRPLTPKDLRAEARAAVEKLDDLRATLKKADRGSLRGLLRQLVKRIELWWEPPTAAEAKADRRLRHVFARGELVLTDMLSIFQPAQIRGQ